MTIEQFDRIDRNLDRMELAWDQLKAERDALNEAVSKALAAQLGAETTLELLSQERCGEYGCDHRRGRHATDGDVCVDCLAHYAAPAFGLSAHAFTPSRSTEGDRRAFASAQRSEDSERPPVPGVK